MRYMGCTQLNRVISLLLAGTTCVFGLGGCSHSVNSESSLHPVLSNSEPEFQTQANLPPTAKTLYVMAEILATQGRDQQCELLLKRIIEEHPKFPLAYNSLAELQMRQGRVDEAIETISSGLRVRSRDPVLLNNLGMCWIVRGDYEKALETFTKAAGIMPENTKYRMNMAVALGLMNHSPCSNRCCLRNRRVITSVYCARPGQRNTQFRTAAPKD